MREASVVAGSTAPNYHSDDPGARKPLRTHDYAQLKWPVCGLIFPFPPGQTFA